MSQLTRSRATTDRAGRSIPPVLLIGLDGATYTVLAPLLADGTMPTLARLITEGRHATMSSTAHPLSPPAWASIITGRQPGDHGIFDFVRVDHGSGHPAYTLVSSADLRAPTIFELADRAGLTVTALNFPTTFPPPRVNGYVVPGYVPSSYLGRACRPRQLYAELVAEAGLDAGRLAVDWELERTAVQGLDSSELTHWVDLHIEREQQWAAITHYLMRTHPTDLTAVLFDGVDRIQHLCLHLLLADPAALGPADRRTRDRCLDYFGLVDRILHQTVELAGSDATVLIVSDHGAEVAGSRIFYANSWLEQQGLLRWSDDVRVDQGSRLALNGNTEAGSLFDWSGTAAAALTSSSNAIVVHRSVRPGDGGISDQDRPRFCRRLADALLQVVDPATGEPVVDRVLLGADTFPGQFGAEAPDLTLVLHQPGFLSVLRGPAITAERRAPYGTHHRDGIVIAHGPGIGAGAGIPAGSANAADSGIGAGGQLSSDGCTVLDVAPTVLQLLRLPIPVTLRGTALVGVPTDANRATASAAVPGPTDTDQPETDLAETDEPDPAFDPAGEAEILDRLRRLGYLE